MGWNASVVVLLDALGFIENDPEFGKKLADAITMFERNEKTGRYASVSARRGNSVHCNAATVISKHHADSNSIIAVGGNCGTVLGYTYGTHHKEEDKLRILKSLAKDLGYSLRKLPKKKHEMETSQ